VGAWRRGCVDKFLAGALMNFVAPKGSGLIWRGGFLSLLYSPIENTYNKTSSLRHFHLHNRHLHRRPTSYEYTQCCHKQSFVRDSVELDNLKKRRIKIEISRNRTVLKRLFKENSFGIIIQLLSSINGSKTPSNPH